MTDEEIDLARQVSQLKSQLKFYRNKVKVEEKVRVKALKANQALRKENERYKQAVDRLSAENSKHKKQIKRLMNKG